MGIQTRPLRYFAEHVTTKRRSVLLSEKEAGKGLRVVARNDPKHIAEQEQRVLDKIEAMRKITEGES